MALAPGDVFAGYRITDVLGSGGMGTVYRVAHPRLDRDEALKTITPVPGIEDAGERFRREAKAAANLHHPGIVTIHEYGVDGEMPWYTMEYLDGDDLAKVAGQLPVGEVAESISRVASALDYAHARDVVHRDVKPANIILTRGEDRGLERVVVVDFGIAKNVTDATHLTQPFTPLGSPPYMAPEIIRGEQASPASDQYSLAVSAFQALTGHTPYRGTTGELMAAHASEDPPSITRHRPDLAAADSVLRRGLAKDPVDRYSTCGEFAAALAGALANQSRETIVPPGDATALTARPRTTPRRKIIIVAVVAVVAAATAVSGIVWQRSQHQVQRADWHLPNPPGVAQGSWTSISTSSEYGLRTKGTTVCGIAAAKVYCWGTDNSRAQLGNGSTEPASGTQLVAGQKEGSSVSALSVGPDYTCAIVGTKKRVTCWGTGPLNIADEKDKNDKQGPITDAVSVSTSPYRACAALANGNVECWGMTAKLVPPFGQDKPVSDRATRMNVFPRASSVVTTSRATCVIETGAGSVACHGLTETGGLIADAADYKAFPPTIAGPVGVTGLAAVAMGATWCATTSETVYCWGDGVYGVIGNGQRAAGPFSPTRLEVLSNPTSIAGSGSVFCAAAGGSAYCWGDDVGSGSLGQPPGQYYTPTKVAGLSKVTSVAVGPGFSCAIADGERYCWGKPPRA